MFANFLMNGLINGSLIALLALGFALVYNTTRVFHIAYAALYTIAGYMMYLFFVIKDFPFSISLLLVILITCLLSMGMEYFVYKPLSKKGNPPNTLMISSIGMLILLINLLIVLFGNDPKIFPYQALISSTFRIGNVAALPAISFLVNLGLILIFFVLLKFSRLGIMIRSLRDNELMSGVFGVDTYRLRLFLFALSGAMVAVAAAFRSMDVGVNPHVGMPIFINAFVALVIGGIGRFEGPIFGAFILGILQSLAEYFMDSQWVVLFTFLILILFVIYKPEGLIPERQRAY